METTVSLSDKEFRKVRYARGTYPPKGRMYYMEEFPENYDLSSAIKHSILKTTNQMLTIPIPLFGVKGIRYMARKMKKWPKKLGDRKASLYLGQVVRMLEEIGTGGAGFRFMYAAFLQEAATAGVNLPSLPAESLKDEVEKMNPISRQQIFSLTSPTGKKRFTGN